MAEQCREDGEAKRMTELGRMAELVQAELDAIWSRPSTPEQPGVDEATLDASLLILQRRLLWSSYQADLFDRMRAAILDALRTAEAASLRSKALKALGQIVERDPSVFGEDDVRLAIEDRFKDTQPSVRDAAFDLLGKHVVYDPVLAIKYLPRIGDRITDTGLSVRKRVVKLLKSIYIIVQDPSARADICARLISRLRDDDDGIKVREDADEECTDVDRTWPSARSASCSSRPASMRPANRPRAHFANRPVSPTVTPRPIRPRSTRPSSSSRSPSRWAIAAVASRMRSN